MLFGVKSFAVPMDNLYTSVIQVTDNTFEARNQVLPQAFDQVVKKVASSHDVFNHPEFIAARQHIDRFVTTFFYVENGDSYALTLRFNEQMINNLLTKTGHNTFGKERPQILMWMVLDDQGKQNFVTQGPQAVLANKIENLSNSYGVPVYLPLMDLTERLFITEQDVLNSNIAPLLQASERYNSDLVLLGKGINQNGVWNCQWQLLNGNNNISWDTSSISIDEQLEQLFNQLSVKIIASQQIATEPEQEIVADQTIAPKQVQNKKNVTIRITGINSINEYAKTFAQLKKLSIAQQVEIGSVNDNQATFIITATGGREAIIKALKNDNYLIAEPAISDQNLTYRIKQ